MDFLYKLYSNQYFALILFSIIAILLVLFIVVLIAAMKDAKKRKLETTVNDEKTTDIQEVEDKENIPVDQMQNSKVEPAFIEENKEVELQTPQSDITLDEPNNENSMNDLLNEFEKPEIDFQTIGNDLDALIAKVSLNENENTEKVDKNKLTEDVDLDDDFELPAIKKEEVVDNSNDNFSEIKEETPEVIEEPKEEMPEINLEGTGVLNFSNVETESYEIKK